MAYRERTAWLTLVCMALAYTVYFSLVALRPTAMTLFDILWTFGTVSATQAVVVIVGSIALALNAGPAANRDADERDKAIARRGASAAYYVLMVGMILVGVVMPFGDPAPKTVNTALLALVVAEGVRLVIMVASYRRGWHG
jgi:hypothetical protein